jgi:hypothetical protein
LAGDVSSGFSLFSRLDLYTFILISFRSCKDKC